MENFSPDINEIIGQNLRAIREKKALTQEGLAFYAQTSAAYIGNIERGEGNPTINTLNRIATVLNVPLSQLLTPAQEQTKETVLSFPSSSFNNYASYFEKLPPSRQQQLLAVLDIMLVKWPLDDEA